MKFTKVLVEALRMAALFGAIVLVVWSMPEHDGLHAEHAAAATPPFTQN